MIINIQEEDYPYCHHEAGMIYYQEIYIEARIKDFNEWDLDQGNCQRSVFSCVH